MMTRLVLVIFLCFAGSAHAQGLFKAYFPETNGLFKVNSRLFVDDLEQAEKIQKMIKIAEAENLKFFGKLRAKPKYVVCTKALCAERFGLRPAAVTIGHHRIVVGPNGLHAQVFVHERVHSEVNREVGILGIASGRVPMWFNEGLASHVAQNTFGKKPSGLRIRHEWVKEAKTAEDWNRFVFREGAQRTYQSAQFIVGDIARRAGDDALARFVQGLGDVRDFEAALKELLRGT